MLSPFSQQGNLFSLPDRGLHNFEKKRAIYARIESRRSYLHGRRARELWHNRCSKRATGDISRSKNLGTPQDHANQRHPLCWRSRKRRSQRQESDGHRSRRHDVCRCPSRATGRHSCLPLGLSRQVLTQHQSQTRRARYTVEISPREESFVANVSLGIVGAMIDASVNENGGAFKLRFIGRNKTS